MPTAEATTGDQQKSHQKQQRPSWKNCSDQNTCSQCHSKHTQEKGTVTMMVMMHLPRLLSASVYALQK